MREFIDSIKGPCIAEFLGTGLFIFFGTSVLSAVKLAGAELGLWEICIVWGLGIALAVYLAAGISGAHLNPAVTVSLWLFARFDGKKVIPYALAQIAGAFCGAALTYLLYHTLFIEYEQTHQMMRGSQDSLFLASIFTTYPAASISTGLAAVVEIIITSMLIGLIMALTDDDNGVPKGPLAPLLIGILVAVIGTSTAPLTGFAMNPARDFGPRLFIFFEGWGTIAMTGGRKIPYFLVPLAAPVLGGLLGASIYRYGISRYLPGMKTVDREDARTRSH